MDGEPLTLTPSSSNTTTVNLNKGTIYGDAYGGGLGSSDVAAYVGGDVVVNQHEVAFYITNYTSEGHTDVVKSGRIFGANNLNGSPQGDVTVNLYKTVAGNVTRTAEDTSHPGQPQKGTGVTSSYELAAVYGGGNLADYTATGKKASVNILTCDVSVQNVYGGGNAAAVPGTDVLVAGAYEISEVFGGGNGKDDYTLDNGANWTTNPGADVNGNTNTLLKGGYIHEAYGGSNQKGNITGTATINAGTGGVCDLDVGKIVGAGKNADINGDVVMTLDCMPSAKIPLLFAGADNANVNGNVELTITNGNFGKVFGGNNEGGAIKGYIRVNVEETGCRPINIDELYTCGNQAAYSVYGYKTGTNGKLEPRTSLTDGTAVDPAASNYSETQMYANPEVNVISCTYIGKVFGGGYGENAIVYGNPIVNINMIPGAYASQIDADGDGNADGISTALGAVDDVYGGGNQAAVHGNTTVNIGAASSVVLNTEPGYLGSGNYTYDSSTEKYVVSTGIGANIIGRVFGAGKGLDDDVTAAVVTGNSTVNMGGGNVAENVYGGGEMASVGDYTRDSNGVITAVANNTGTSTVNISGGSVGPANMDFTNINSNGDVFGGGLGKAGSEFSTFAYVNTGNVTISGTAHVRGSVFGGGENGHVKGDTHVNIDGGEVGLRIPYTYRNISSDAGSSNPVYVGNVYGGGRGVDHTAVGNHLSETAGRVYGNTNVSVTGGQIHHSVYGGGSLASVGTYTLTEDATVYGGHLHNFSTGTGNATVSVSGGRIGPTWAELLLDDDGTTSLVDANGDATSDAAAIKIARNYECLGENEGMVYGSGRGVNYPNDDNTDHKLYVEMAFTNNTTVTISGTADVVGSVFGGGENGHVKGNTQVNIQGGTIGGIPLHHKGLDLPGHTAGHGHINDNNNDDDELNYNETGIGRSVFRGNVYGGGRGIDHTSGDATTSSAHIFSVSAGRVYGNTVVNVTGGNILHNVFGGGSIASVGTYTYPGNNFFTNPSAVVGSTGKATVNISGGRIGVMGENEGYVYGGGRGIAGTNETQVSHLAFVNETEVNISSDETNNIHADVRASVFGGGMNGHVLTNTKVTVSGGVIGGKTAAEFGSGANSYDPTRFPSVPASVDYTLHGIEYYSGIAPADAVTGQDGVGAHTVFLGNVYGGGRGVDVTSGSNLSYTAGRVFGNTEVEITGGVIYHSVFGGGSIASVGTYTTYTAAEATADAALTERYRILENQPKICTSGGTATVTVKGSARIGTDGLNSGRVFGSSRGMAGASYRGLGYVNSSHVIIGDGTDTPQVRGSVFGSGENGHVLTNTLVEVKSGHIGNGQHTGTDAWKDSYVGNVYGGGRGVDREIGGGGTVSEFAGRVYGYTDVRISGGQIDHNVYGGGSLASVGRFKRNSSNTITSADEDNITGVTYVTSDTEHTHKRGTANVTISGGTIGIDGDENGHVFGSSRGTSAASSDIMANLAYTNYTNVTVSGGHVWGSVFGGGESGHVQNNTEVTVGGGEIGSSLSGSYASLSDSDKEKYDLMGNVYAAGRGVDPYTDGTGTHYSYSAGYVRGNSTVTVSGGTIHRNVYGGGSMGLTGNYGPYGEEDFWQGTFTRNATTNLGEPSVTNGVATVNINSSVGTEADVANGYGGNVFGSSRGKANTATDTNDYAEMAYTFKTNVTVDATGHTVWGNVYGGGENGHVDWGGTTVTVKNGTINGNVFGGGKGSLSSPTAGIVDGPTQVYIGTADQASNTVVIGGDVFGGNDTHSSPLGIMRVDVYKTAHISGTNTTDDAGYALRGVYGGGNLAHVLTGVAATDDSDGNAANVSNDDYITQRISQTDGSVPAIFKPWPGGTTRQSFVHVHGCDNTIQYVYGGGKQADSQETDVTIEGGRIWDVFGGGQGDLISLGSGHSDVAANVRTNAKVLINGGTIQNVFGGGNVNGNIAGTITVDIDLTSECGLTANNVYGGGNLAAYNPTTPGSYPAVTVKSGTAGNVFGGGLGASAIVHSSPVVTIQGGIVTGNVYGGGSEADVTQNVTVNITGGRVLNDVYGGGALANTNTDNWNPSAFEEVTGVIVGETPVTGFYTAQNDGSKITDTDATAEDGQTYYQKGTWATGKNDPSTGTTYKTTVNLTGGIIGHLANGSANDYLGGNVYGGGLGRLASTGVEAKEAMVYGDITVTLGDDVDGPATAFVQRFITPPAETDPKISNADVPFSGRLFGCNNLNGSPKGDVTVTVWKTIQMDGETPMDGHSENKFDVHSVYGGGNLACYQPADGKTTKVRIHGCSDTTIEKVFGGGNSAYVPSTDVIIYGCYYVGYAFGGGNGADRVWKNGAWYLNDGAPVYGDASIIAVGGKIGQVFSGSDTKGTIYGNATIKLKGKDDASLGGLTGECDLKITNAYGAGRGADIEHNVIMIVSGCIGNNSIERVFGGSYDANIRGDINLTITSGIYTQVFGGNDHGGTVGGNINVNIEESDNCNPTIIMYLYGGGREAAYPGVGAKNLAGEDVNHGKITINVKSATRIDNIFGGNFRAPLNGDTEVNINMIKGDWVGKPITFPDNYRGDKIPNVNEPEEVYNLVTDLDVADPVTGTPASSLTGLYTREALDTDPVTYKYNKITDPDLVYDGTGEYYQMTMTEGTIMNAIGTIGNIYGGSYMSTTTGNTTVNIGTAKFTTILKRATAGGHPLDTDGNSIYDGEGKLRDKITLDYDTKNVLGAHITGNVYGGGYMADVTGNATVNICAVDDPSTPTVVDYKTVDFRTGITWASGESYEGIKVLGTVYGGGYQGSVGKYNVSANGKPTSLKLETGEKEEDFGNTYVNVMGDAAIGPDNMVMPTFIGHVFGGSQGYVADPAVDNQVENRAFANSTYVTIGDRAFVKGSVYGGSENGHVLHDTYVYIKDNCQIGNGYAQMADDGSYLASPLAINRPYTSDEWEDGKLIPVTGDPAALATLASTHYKTSLPECASWKYGKAEVAANKYVPYDKFNYGGGNTTGDDGHTFYGNVFGGGSGYFPYASGKWLRTAGRVEGDTHVIISGGHVLTSIYGGNELTDVLGNTHVVMTGGSLGVPRTLGQIDKHPVTCYLFGAGKGDQRTDFNQWTNVKNAYVHVSDDARVYGSVFGGGEDGHVYGDAITAIGSSTLFGYTTLPAAISGNAVLSALTLTGTKTKDKEGNDYPCTYPYIGTWGTSYVEGNIFGGGRGYSGEALSAGAVCGNTLVNISGGTMLGSIYGGGRLAGVGTRLLADTDPNYGELIGDTEDPYSTGSTTHGHTTINISGGTIGNNIEYVYEPASGARTNMPKTVFDDSNRLMHTKGGNVFAGSMGRREKQGSTTEPMTNWKKLGIVKSTKLNISGTAWIKGNVFGGGEFGAVTGSHSATVNGQSANVGTEINISGGTIGTMMQSGVDPSTVTSSTTGTGDSRYTFGSVYGGGYGTEAEATLTTSEVETFGAYVTSNTYVNMMTGGKVLASVYGGGEMASVKSDTYVNVRGGEIGIGELKASNYVLFGSWRMGNVYGGGKGSTTAVYSGIVKGNTNVNISGGAVYHNVYGGGALSSVGTYTLATTAAPPIQIGTPTACTAGGTANVTITGGQIGINGWDNGMVNGSGRGDISTNKPTGTNPYDVYDNLGWVNNSIVTIGTSGQGFGTSQPQIKGTVYGGGENGHNMGNASVTVHSGTIGTSATSNWDNGNVFGSGCGTDTYDESTDAVKYFNPMGGRVKGNTTVTIDGGHILRSAYGGGSMASVDGSTSITVSGGRIGTDGSNYGCVYGGPKGNLKADRSAHVGSTEVNISYGTTPASDNGTTTQLITNSVYGGGEAGIVYGGVAVNMNGGLVLKDVYGGGALANTNTSNWNASTNSWATSPTAMYNSSTGTTTHTTAVNLHKGTINGDVYGGGLGRLARSAVTGVKYTQAEIDAAQAGDAAYGKTTNDWKIEPAAAVDAIAAKVYGDIMVKLNETTATDECKVKGNIFGCNNLNGSPQNNVVVHVYKTQGYDDLHKKSASKDNTTYDVNAVYGGGDLAMYKPDLDAVANIVKATVIIDGCDLTSIKKVYGGGNAASVPATLVRVNGTYEIGELFGGGNGKDDISYDGGTTMIDNPGANVGYINYSTLSGTTWTENSDADTKEKRLANTSIQYGDGSTSIVVTGGKIHVCYGGSDTKGNVRRSVTSSYEDSGACSPMSIDETYGGGKDAPMDADIEVNLECAEDMATIFGGSKNADLNSNVMLHITNGTYGKVFGGNNTSGAVNGSITVTIEEKGCKPVIIGELYGGGYLAPYSVYGYKKKSDGTYDTESVSYVDTDGSTKSLAQRIPLTSGTAQLDPRINIISATSIGTIYGGGYQAKVVGSPHINVNMERGKVLAKYANNNDGTIKDAFTVDTHTDAHGDKYVVDSHVAGEDAFLAIGTIGTVFGGGNMADVVGNTYVDIGTGSWVKREKSGGVITEITETLSRKAATITNNVYGGGKMGNVGNVTSTDANGKPTAFASGTGICTVTINNGTIGPDNMTMYHLDGSGNVPATDKPDDHGHVFGGGQGTLDYYYDDYSKTEAEKIAGMLALGSTGTTDEEKAALMDAAMNAKLGKLAFVDSTEVKIGGTAFIQGCVFGGAENGHVLRNTGVKISGGQIGNGHLLVTGDDGTILVNRGLNRSYTPAEWTAGALATTNDDFSAAELAAGVKTKVDAQFAASLPECASWPYGQNVSGGKLVAGTHHAPYDKFVGYSGYSPEGGAKVASSGRTFNGNVFGGGSGYYPYAPGHWLETAGEVEGNTWVVVTGGHILTSLYGGNEMSSVLGDTHVIMQDGTLGVPRTLAEIAAHPVTCYVFGGGKGEARSYLNHDTNVQNATVDVSGGWVYGSVFGGAEDGHVLGNTKVTIRETAKIGTWGTSYVDGNVFGGGRGFDGHNIQAGNVVGNTTINIMGGTMLGSIYGGGRLASVGPDFSKPETSANGYFQVDPAGTTTGLATINISGGVIGHDDATATYGGYVYGGSMGRITTLSGNVNPMWPKTAQVKNTIVNVTGGTIKRDVFGGGETGTVKDNAYVTIGGTRSAASATGTVTPTANSAAIVKGSVFGGGYGSSDNTSTHRAVITADALTFVYTPMMFAGCVGGDTYVDIVGGTVRKNVYGGGNMASVGVIDYRANYNSTIGEYTYMSNQENTDASTSFALSWPRKIEYSPFLTGGTTHINITGGRIGISGEDYMGPVNAAGKPIKMVGSAETLLTNDEIEAAMEDNGDVYGASKGIVGNRYDMAFSANVKNTDVKVHYATTPAEGDIDVIEKWEDGKSKYSLRLNLEKAGIAGSVYGGGEDGHVIENTSVDITGGHIGHAVYGGGKGKTKYTTASSKKVRSITAGKVYGNTSISMSGGRVVRNIYGGGNLASVGKGNYAGGSDDFYPGGYGEKLSGALWDKVSDDSKAFMNSGKSTINITGGSVGFLYESTDPKLYTLAGTESTLGTIYSSGDDATKQKIRNIFAKDELPLGNVFGGCRGQAVEETYDLTFNEDKPDFFLGYMNETEVEIGDKTKITDDTYSGPHIYGSVYGGGQDGHVRRGTNVIVNKAEIGIPYTTANRTLLKTLPASPTPEQISSTADLDDLEWLHRGNIYGGGSGIGKYEESSVMKNSPSAGSVNHSTTVEVKGGIIHRNVYGGGSLASVCPPTAYGGNVPSKTGTPGMVSLNTVTISGTIGTPTGYNPVYGGEVYGASRGDKNLDPVMFAVSVWTQVNIQKGAHIMGNVFGGGDSGKVLKDTNVVIGEETTP